MRTRHVAMLVAGLVLALMPPAQAAPPAVTNAPDALDEAGRWLTQLDEVIASSMAALDDAMAGIRTDLPKLLDPAQRAGAVPRLRAAVAEAQAGLARSRAQLERIKAQGLPALPGIAPRARIVGLDAQLTQMNGLLVDCDAMFAAIASGDMDRLAATSARLRQGSFLLIESRILMFDNERLRSRPDESSHQAAAVQMRLYMIMRDLMVARASDDDGRQRDPAVLSGQLRDHAQALRTLSATGRGNLKRELAEVDTESARAPAMRGEYQRIKALFGVEEESFVVSDALASWLDTARTSRLGGSDALPVLTRELVAFEGRLTEISAHKSHALMEEPGSH